MQICAVAKRGVAINRLDQALGDGLCIQAEELGEFPHAFAMRQPDHDSLPVRWHSH